MRKSTLGMMVGALVGVLAAPSADASGGGACPPPITNGSATKSTIKNYCFEPTVLYVKPGDTVTWVNRDPATHTVTGANRAWGSYKNLKVDASVTYRFNRPGVYPYYCVLHVGMVGTVVAGNGKFSGVAGRRAEDDAVTKVRAPAPQALGADLVVVPDRESTNRLSWAAVAAAIGLSLAMPVVLTLARRRRATREHA